jgi:GNAT superfamily N-acetyltransferase
MMERMMAGFKELVSGQEEQALSFLDSDPVRNLRIIWALRRWGLFDIGLPEQGRYLAYSEGGKIKGLLLFNNLGLWRLAAHGAVARGLAAEALSLWGAPEILAGTEKEVEALLQEVEGLAGAVEHKEKEMSLILCPEDFHPIEGEAVLAAEDDLDDLVDLERELQLELLGSCAAAWVIRSQMRMAVEEGAAALVRWEDDAVAKAAMEALTPKVDELGGVFTRTDYRLRGFASTACTLVCASSLAKGKKVRLETQRDNQVALRFYGRLGFRELWPHLAIRFKGTSS